MAKKKLILINDISSLNHHFTQAFNDEGYEVYSILKEPIIFRKTLLIKFLHFFYRVVLKNKYGYYKKAYYYNMHKEIYKRLNAIDNVDFAVVFSAQYYPEKIINLLRIKAKKMVAYQVDGWTMCKNVIKHKDNFDRVFFFDKADLSKFGDKALPITNCYFIDNDTKNISNDIDIFYLGGGTPKRIQCIQNLYNRLNHKVNINAIITIPKYQQETQWKNSKIKLSHTGISYQENINLVKKSKCLVDIKFNYHNGLSFRFFESLYYKKKLITNNETIKDYDFYHPNNIFITNFENLDGIEDFLEKPYVEIDEKIVKKYGFPNWSRYLLDIPPYQEITFH